MYIEIKTYHPAFGDALEALQRKYMALQPQGTKFVPRALYDHHPALEGGKNVFCAFGRDQNLVGYGALFPTRAEADSPADVPNTVWVHIRVDPEAKNASEIQDAVYGAILKRSSEYSERWRERRTRVAISYPDARQEEIAFFAAQGLEPFDALVRMVRNLSEPLDTLSLPTSVTVRRWRMASKAEQEKYLAAEKKVFPQSARTLEELRFYMRSWVAGTAITAFDGTENIVGSVMAYWYGEGGVTEDIFVMPDWRGRGIAKTLITEGMRYLLENGKRAASLEVKESNHPAVGLYRSLGYQVVDKELQLGLYL
jgi:ribosomal protein S18 acetylase RimI-like enzyme